MTGSSILRFARLLAVGLAVVWVPTPAPARAAQERPRYEWQERPQETGFLNRKIQLHGATYRFQVYLPEEWRRDDRRAWPIVLFLHGRGERGSEGLWQTQIGLPQAIRDHPDRWPFIVVMPQCPLGSYWTDPEMLALAMATLDRESDEFHADPERTYLTALSLGGYGAWELARRYPRRWGAVAIASGGVFWSYAPERWQQSSYLPGEYASAVGSTPIWLFHGTDDSIVSPRQSELMYEAFRNNGGHIRLWLYQGLKHDCWTRVFNEPELPRWLLAHRGDSRHGPRPAPVAFAERLVIPLHPPAIRLSESQLDSIAGEYRDSHGRLTATLFRQGDELYEKNPQGEYAELAAESPVSFFYPNGTSTTRLTVEWDSQGRVQALLLHDDRHVERWEKRMPGYNR
jgi:poly(3-hydroxybutyrate) depolymerase